MQCTSEPGRQAGLHCYQAPSSARCVRDALRWARLTTEDEALPLATGVKEESLHRHLAGTPHETPVSLGDIALHRSQSFQPVGLTCWPGP